ncbi:MAG: hypothetical protein ACOC7R_01615 [Planctomycetota bacterium]
MAIELKCNCGCEYRLDDNRAGETFTCRVCGATMTLPGGVGRATPPAEETAGAAQGDKVGTASVAAAPEPPAPATRPAPSGGGGLSEFGDSLDTPPPAPTGTPGLTPTPPTGTASPGGTSPSPVGEPPEMSTAGRPARPPLSWWLARAILWGVCAGFLFLPWFSVAAAPPGEETVRESVTGYQFAKLVGQGIGKARIDSGSNGSAHLPEPADFLDVPDGAGRVIAGAGMMTFSPCVYVLGLLLVIAIVPIAARKDGAGAMWPSLACLVGLGGFIVGWHLLAGSEPLGPQLEIASQVGITIGVTGWAYAMVALLVPITLIARAKPDYRLIQAAQWSKQQSSTGPL